LNTKFTKFILWPIMFLGLLAGLLFAWLYFSTLRVKDVQPENIVSLPNVPTLQSGQAIKVLSWNVQFLAGNENNHFFFDDGEDTWPSSGTRQKILKQIAEVIIAEQPDVILLQEVDEGAKRTEYEDQLAALLALLPREYGNHASTFYWQANFVPHPSLMGAVGMKLSTLSKYQITRATRHALTGIGSQSWIIQQMNPKRAVLETHLPIGDSKTLRLFNTHLSAFAQNSDTMQVQVKQVMDLTIKNQPGNVIIGGDFNLLPSSYAYSLLDDQGKSYYNPNGTELSPMLNALNSIPSVDNMSGQDHADWFTYSPNHISAASPDRTIDYLFYSSDLTLVKGKVRSHDTPLISDHLPVIGMFTLP